MFRKKPYKLEITSMIKLEKFINFQELKFIKTNDQLWLTEVFKKFSGFPTLEKLWKIMDEIWEEYGCDDRNLDSRVENFYSHPVWLLNGLFIEQHQESINNRQIFTKWVIAQKPKRIADYGGGFGTLARMIAKSCPNADVEIIEPHPHRLAIERANSIDNLSYQKKLEGKYDILIATDVFEHVLDPLALAAKTSMSLKTDGLYLIANCFEPVIKCHLSQYYHFYHTFNHALEAMNLKIVDKVIYGTIFKFNQKLNLDEGRKIEKKSQKLWYLTRYLHRKISNPITKFII